MIAGVNGTGVVNGRERGRESPVAVQLAVECVHTAPDVCGVRRSATIAADVQASQRQTPTQQCERSRDSPDQAAQQLPSIAGSNGSAAPSRSSLVERRPVVVANSSCGGEKGWVTAGEQQSLSALTRAGGEAC